MVSGAEVATMHLVNQLANRSSLFDDAMVYVHDATLLKGVVLLAIVHYVVFNSARYPAQRREEVLSAFVTSAFALTATRAFSASLPFRQRPIFDAMLGFQPPHGFVTGLDAWSAFPSDHAVLYVMLATSICFASARLGALAVAYVAVVILWPRVYLGLHWPSDIAAGAALGFGFAHGARAAPLRERIARAAASLRERAPGAFFAGLFVWSYLLATHFDEVRRLGRVALRVLGHGVP